MSPDASGWRAIASIAEPPILPIPKPAPITARPAPIAAPNLLTPTAAAVACKNTDSKIIFSFKMVDIFSCFYYLIPHSARLFRIRSVTFSPRFIDYSSVFTLAPSCASPINTADNIVNT